MGIQETMKAFLSFSTSLCKKKKKKVRLLGERVSVSVSEFTSIGVQGVQELEHILQEILPKSHNFQPLILT